LYHKAFRDNACLKLFDSRANKKPRQPTSSVRNKDQHDSNHHNDSRKKSLIEEKGDIEDNIPPEEYLYQDDVIYVENEIRQKRLFRERQQFDDSDDEKVDEKEDGKHLEQELKPNTSYVNDVRDVPKDAIPEVEDDHQKGIQPKTSLSQRFFSFFKKNDKLKDQVSHDEEVEENVPLLSEKKKEKVETFEPEGEDLIQMLKAQSGLWPDIDPLDSAWLDLINESKITGSVCVSIQIWPKEMALLQPVGIGRNEPNTNPFLPPRVGRFYFTW